MLVNIFKFFNILLAVLFQILVSNSISELDSLVLESVEPHMLVKFNFSIFFFLSSNTIPLDASNIH